MKLYNLETATEETHKATYAERAQSFHALSRHTTLPEATCIHQLEVL